MSLKFKRHEKTSQNLDSLKISGKEASDQKKNKEEPQDGAKPLKQPRTGRQPKPINFKQARNVIPVLATFANSANMDPKTKSDRTDREEKTFGFFCAQSLKLLQLLVQHLPVGLAHAHHGPHNLGISEEPLGASRRSALLRMSSCARAACTEHSRAARRLELQSGARSRLRGAQPRCAAARAAQRRSEQVARSTPALRGGSSCAAAQL